MESKSSQLSISNSLSFSSKCQLLESPLDCLIPKLGGCHREYKKGKMAKGRKMTVKLPTRGRKQGRKSFVWARWTVLVCVRIFPYSLAVVICCCAEAVCLRRPRRNWRMAQHTLQKKQNKTKPATICHRLAVWNLHPSVCTQTQSPTCWTKANAPRPQWTSLTPREPARATANWSKSAKICPLSSPWKRAVFTSRRAEWVGGLHAAFGGSERMRYMTVEEINQCIIEGWAREETWGCRCSSMD